MRSGWRGRKNSARRAVSRGWRYMLALACMASVVFGLLAWPQLSVHAAPGGPGGSRAPGGRLNDPVVRAVDIAQPAVVRLATIYNATITFFICGQTVTLPSGGRSYTLGGLGSGAFISANGDILTADHVVDIPKADLDAEIFQDPNAAQDIADFVNANCHLSAPVAASDIASGALQFTPGSYETHYSAPQRLVWLPTAYSGPISGASSQDLLRAIMAAPHQVATVEGSSSFTENDLAIVHVSLTDTPSIQLDNSADVAVDDPLTIIGFPGNGDATNDGTDLLTASVNNVTVSAIKNNSNGSKLIQVGGNVEHGDSGGPALDANGHVVGVVSFGGIDQPDGTSFLRSTNDALSLISSANVSTKPGSFQTLWQQAFTDYAATYSGHWHKAAQELDHLSNAYPNFKGVQVYKTYADSAAQTEVVGAATSAQQAIIVAMIIVVALILALLVLLLVMLRRRRNTRLALAKAQAAGPAGYPYGGYNGYGAPAAPSNYGPYGAGSIYRPILGGAGQAPMGEPMQQQQFQPQGGSTPNAAPAPVGAMTPSQPDAMSLRDVAANAPMGQMPAAPSWNAGYGQAGMEAPYPMQTPSSVQPGHPGLGGPWDTTLNQRSQAPSMPSAAPVDQGVCLNGHPMLPNEVYCALCGAQRRPATFPGSSGI